MTVLSVVGARPQFIKAAPLVRAIACRHRSMLVHTGQHYDANMSDVFFDELGLPAPDVHLGIGSGPHGAQTGAMLSALEPVMIETRPDWVVVYGDTNSTLAGALTAAKLDVRVAHVEAGLRSFNRAMPEEINRLVADHLSDLLLCPSDAAIANLKAEGRVRGVHRATDTMIEALTDATSRARAASTVLDRLSLAERGYVLATVHRAENTNSHGRLGRIVAALDALGEPVVFPVHPRTRRALADAGFTPGPAVTLLEPVGYLDMVRLESSARLIVTDSGGVQKEAFWLGVPCVTVRDETEWTETVESGWNVLAGTDTQAIIDAVRRFAVPATRSPLYGEGRSSQAIVHLLEEMR
jgi:UDP-N-acetylglucosamine 2-epimerase